jgi:hypothetical protein
MALAADSDMSMIRSPSSPRAMEDSQEATGPSEGSVIHRKELRKKPKSFAMRHSPKIKPNSNLNGCLC